MQMRVHEVAIRFALVALGAVMRAIPAALACPPQGLQCRAQAGWWNGVGGEATEGVERDDGSGSLGF